MNINIKDYLLTYIGDTSWYGESNHDTNSLDNFNKLEEVLRETIDIQDELYSLILQHKNYRIGNASAEALHKKAGSILLKYHNSLGLQYDNFNKYWEDIK